MHVELEYLAVGGNRIPGASDWCSERNTLAFGAGQNVAISDSSDGQLTVRHLLRGHLDNVTAVKFLPPTPTGDLELVTGSEDATIRIWRRHGADRTWSQISLLQADSGTITCLGIIPGEAKIVAGFTSRNLLVWQRDDHDVWNKLFAEDFALSMIPLAIATTAGQKADDFTIFAAGTSPSIHILKPYASNRLRDCGALQGHEGWIRSLSITTLPCKRGESEYLLASGSQDRTIRLWRVVEQVLSASSEDKAKPTTLQSKQLCVFASTSRLLINFETILLGHDDWIYSLQWYKYDEELHLLSSSADGSFIIWSAGRDTAFWEVKSSIGELSIQKGSTTATGSAGGLFTALSSHCGTRIVSLGRTGSWQSWIYDREIKRWECWPGTSGHTQAVEDLAWSRSGNALYSVSSDQTTRLHAERVRGGQVTWHEIGRPQIHGYNIACLATLPSGEIATAAEEKIVRIFSRPASTARLMNGLRGSAVEYEGNIINASIPVLGLSNKEQSSTGEQSDDQPSGGHGTDAALDRSSELNDIPPTEDILNKSTLWPEIEKLYGHGFEMSAIASGNANGLLATACRASGIEHAGIRVFSSATWNEICPPLLAHSSTVHSLAFSHDDQYLLSAGKDRRWAIFRASRDRFELLINNENAHSRMIMAAAWVPNMSSYMFVTVGRDRALKLWRLIESVDNSEFESCQTIDFAHVPTSVDCGGPLQFDHTLCAVGLENGNIEVFKQDVDAARLSLLIRVDACFCPSRAISSLAWRPDGAQHKDDDKTKTKTALAIAAADNSLRVIALLNASA